MEAVKQGSAGVGIKSNTHAVLASLKVCLLPFMFRTDCSHGSVGVHCAVFTSLGEVLKICF